MNPFTVFASAKKGFQEKYASAIHAWLLQPELEQQAQSMGRPLQLARTPHQHPFDW